MNTNTATATTAEFAVSPSNYSTAREWADAEKVARGCENPECMWAGEFDACQLEWAHLIPGTAYLTRDGVRVHPSDMVKSGASAWNSRYAAGTIFAEILKCRVLCACCHALESKNERG